MVQTEKRMRILLAEDHTVVREGIRDLLEREPDMEVVGEAADGEQAVRMVGELTPDLVLMDIAMPGGGGVEATRRIREAHPDTAVLVLTAYDNTELVVAVLEAGAAGYLLKNVRGEELLRCVRAVARGDSVLDPSVARTVLLRLREGAPPRSEGPVRGSGEPHPLSVREMEVVRLGAEGLVNKEIAARLSLSDRTVQTHWRNIFVKLGVSSRVEAIMRALRSGWIELGREEER